MAESCCSHSDDNVNGQSQSARLVQNHRHHDHYHETSFATLKWVLILTGLYMLVEFFGGLWTNSLALLADSGHMLTDVGAISLALFAAWFSEHPATPQRTFGYYRIEILAAFVNGLLLVGIAGFVIVEAFQRAHHPSNVNGGPMMLIALGGIIINLASAYILHAKADINMNVRAAFLHVLSDTLGSLGAVVAGWLIWQFHWLWADVVFSLAIALLVLLSAVRLIWDAVNVLLESSPAHLSVAAIEEALMALPQVACVHDLHVWTIASGRDALSAHVEVASIELFQPTVLADIQQMLKSRFGLFHVTIQLEPPDFESHPQGCHF